MKKLFKLTVGDANGSMPIYFESKRAAKDIRKSILEDPDREPFSTVSCVQRGPDHWKGETS